ncbi:hypothetical protein O181_018395 [Austropuccinia psidii MF-1]|uniref:Chromo domain-containing protein n=1 Tax=Austropuccinia psidii MF-1 TaxID=1389203 RepID=A0A9Q3C9S6_9BASI|nr:hypothetical protein [Austropuccinia psidii MF-1]
MVEKGWNPLFPVDHLTRELLSIHPTAKYFHYVWKKACDTEDRCISEAKEYKKQRYDKTQKEPDIRKDDQVDRENAVEVRLTEECSRKHPVFPVSLIKPYYQTVEDKFPSRNKSHFPKYIVELEDCPGPVKKIINQRKRRLNGKYYMKYLVRFKNQTADKHNWLAEDAFTDGDLHLRIFRASRSA